MTTQPRFRYSVSLYAVAGKFPLKALFKEGKAGVYADHGFASSQAAALPVLWFEAGDMHGEDDDGYPVVPQPGFAPFVMMLQRHVPWADERLRGSYYQRAWQVRSAGSLARSGERTLDSPSRKLLQPRPALLPRLCQVGVGEAGTQRDPCARYPPTPAALPRSFLWLGVFLCRRRRRARSACSTWCSPTRSRCSCRMTQGTAAARRRSTTSFRWSPCSGEWWRRWGAATMCPSPLSERSARSRGARQRLPQLSTRPDGAVMASMFHCSLHCDVRSMYIPFCDPCPDLYLFCLVYFLIQTSILSTCTTVGMNGPGQLRTAGDSNACGC
ncbi:hypothetical protein ABPG75_013747 [Micractinium tetrahymenae]